MEKAVHLLISGRVQGVFYRYTAKKMAEHLGVRGWIKNLPDGRVEAVVAGPPSAVDAFVAWCKEGPPGAQVTEVKVSDGPPLRDVKGFAITY